MFSALVLIAGLVFFAYGSHRLGRASELMRRSQRERQLAEEARDETRGYWRRAGEDHRGGRAA